MSGGRTYVAVSYYVDDSYYSNVGRGTTDHAQKIYWRNIAVMFASANKQFLQPRDFLAFSNALPPDDEREVLDRLGVNFVDVGFHQPYPPDFYPRFRGAFHLFDVMEWFASRLTADDRALIVDPDCVWVRDPGHLLSALGQQGVLASSVPYPPGRKANGVSRNDMTTIFREMTGLGVPEPPPYIGGEFLGITGATASRLSVAAGEATQANVARFQAGLRTLNTEEHILTYIFWRLGLRANCDGLMRRIHTSPLWRSVSADPREYEFKLVLWHLLSEKKRGLYDLYNEIRVPASLFWDLEEDEFREYVARRTGVIRGPVRCLEDSLRPPLIRAKHAMGFRRHRTALIRPGE